MIITNFAMRSIDNFLGAICSLFSFKSFMADVDLSAVLFCVFLNFLEEIHHFKE